jgi:hypothetical protein
MKTKSVLIGIGAVIVGLLIVRAALPWYDTDDTLDPVMAKYQFANDNSGDAVCENDTDGAGVKAVPFGAVAETCNAEFFVLFNLFPFQTSGEPVPLKR